LGSNKTIQFSNVRYAAFGLGNSKYKFYNRVIDVVAEALDRKGAVTLMPTGKADDAEGATDEDFTEWKHALFTMFQKKLGFEERPEQYEPTLRVVEDTSLDVIDLHLGDPIKARSNKKGSTPTSPIQALPIVVAKKLYDTPTRSCLHLELDTSDFPELKYKTGDHLAVWPSNPTSEIQRLVTALGLQGRTQTPLLVQSLDPSIPIKVPSPTTWDALFTSYLEVCAPVPRETVAALSQFAPSESSKAALKKLGEDKDKYHEYCSKTHVTLGRLLESVSPPGSWSHLSLSFILESLPLLSPRYYSISSSSIISPKRISITIATSSEATPTQLSIPGLTTNYLLSLPKLGKNPDISTPRLQYNLSGPNNILSDGTKLFAHVRTSKFRLPTLAKHPIIMIASGSGIAPFRGFMMERARLASIGREVGKTLLCFGCRNEGDYLYQDELLSSDSKGANLDMEVVTAFSRQGGDKKYVQDRIEERGEEVMRLLTENNGYLYICGSAGMARGVMERVQKLLREKKGWGEEEVRVWFEGVKRGSRWQEDVWG
jgi:NADPH-ferrihemoprotein reductase